MWPCRTGSDCCVRRPAMPHQDKIARISVSKVCRAGRNLIWSRKPNHRLADATPYRAPRRTKASRQFAGDGGLRQWRFAPRCQNCRRVESRRPVGALLAGESAKAFLHAGSAASVAALCRRMAGGSPGGCFVPLGELTGSVSAASAKMVSPQSPTVPHIPPMRSPNCRAD